MPCYYTGSAEGDRKLAEEERNGAHQETITALTRMLCNLCKIVYMSGHGQLIERDTEVWRWWKSHREIDQRRLRQEAERKLNKAGLTRDEKEALGLK